MIALARPCGAEQPFMLCRPCQILQHASLEDQAEGGAAWSGFGHKTIDSAVTAMADPRSQGMLTAKEAATASGVEGGSDSRPLLQQLRVLVHVGCSQLTVAPDAARPGSALRAALSPAVCAEHAEALAVTLLQRAPAQTLLRVQVAGRLGKPLP